MHPSNVLFLAVIFLGLLACGGPEPGTAASSPATPTEPTIATSPPEEPETTPAKTAEPTTPDNSSPGTPAGSLYTWTTTLNLRDQPSTTGKIVATVAPQDALQPTGKRSLKTTTLTLRGRTFNEPWLEVTTPAGKTGWVYGGAVQTTELHNSKVLQDLVGKKGDNCPLVGTAQDPMEGCSCGFSPQGKRSELLLDVSFAGRACVRLNGQTYQLDGYYDVYNYLDTKNPWILLTDEDWKLFGEKADFSNGDQIIRRLADALLHFEQIPGEIPLRNEMTAGMAVREVRDLATDAVAQARQRRAAGERSGDVRMEYRNDQYRVILTGNKVEVKLSDTGTNYEGLLRVEDANGKVLTDVAVMGHCGC